jgi:alpha-L-fucosidase
MPNRRTFLSQLAGLGLVPGLHLPRGFYLPPAGKLARPTGAQSLWQDLEVGMFVHFAPNTWQDKEYDDRSTPLSAITPDIDTDQWAETAIALGARYIVLVAKHAGGFCLWQTQTTEYGIRNTPWRNGHGDVMESLAASCAARGLGLGVYLSPRDDSLGAGLSGVCATPEAQERYNGIYRQQLTELLTRYGSIVELWLDGSSVVPTGDLVAQHARGAMVFQGPQATIRWVGTEDGFAPYPCWNSLSARDAGTGVATALHGDPDGDVWMPVEVDVSIRRPNWFWSTTNEANLLSTDALLEIYYRSVGHGAQLLINMPPDRSGRIPAADAARAKTFGDTVRRRFRTPLAQTGGAGRQVVLPLVVQQRVDHVILQEDITVGERVRGWRLEGNAWDKWQLLAEGTAIGHKLIQPVAPDGYTMLRLTATRLADEATIRTFAAYNTGEAPPATLRDQPKLWADDAIASWAGEQIDIDITPQLTRAGEYRARLVPEGVAAVEVRDASLSFDGAAQPALANLAPGRRDVVRLTVPVVGHKVMLRLRLRGAERGVVLLQRVAP